MGKQYSKCIGTARTRRHITLLMLGLDNAGKTTTAKHYVGDSIDDTVPTVGFSTMNFRHKMYDVEVYDLGGSSSIRGIWKNYYALAHGVIFVIDSTDKERIDECKIVLSAVVQDPRVSKKPLLLLVNKQDKEEACNEVELCGNIEIEDLVNQQQCPTRVETTAASVQIKKQKDQGIQKGFHWLITHIIKNFDILNKKVEDESQEQREAEEKERLKRIERVRKVREERERKETTLPNEVNESSEIYEQASQDPFRPIAEVSGEALVKDASENKHNSADPRQSEWTNDTANTCKDVGNRISTESTTENDGLKKKKKRFKNKISPSQSSPSISTNNYVDLPPIMPKDTAQET